MIFQCYPKSEYKKDLFKTEPYQGFGLERDVNKLLTLNCPELVDPKTRMQLTEYACFLWHWRNPGHDSDSWIGTTSYRQLDKFPHIFQSKDEIRGLLKEHEIVGWGEYDCFAVTRKPSPKMVEDHGLNVENLPEDGAFAIPISLKSHANLCNPVLGDYIEFMFKKFGHTVPDDWDKTTRGFYANYWVMNKDLFNDFMSFSWPMVKWSLENIEVTHYYNIQPVYGTVSNNKATGYFMERLFMLWYLSKGMTPYNPSEPSQLMNKYEWDGVTDE